PSSRHPFVTQPGATRVRRVHARQLRSLHRRDMRRFPFSANPVGWFSVATSNELPVGGVLPLRYLGRDIVAFRGDDGVARVLDAFCPHLGAHLGHGGTVVGDTIRCPFHGWRFDGAGSCAEAPYARKTPRAELRSWLVCERNGFVMIHHHPGGEPPAWDVPLLSGQGMRPFSMSTWPRSNPQL